MFVHHLKLYTCYLDALRPFYSEKLGLHLEVDDPQQITLLAGHSRITFALSQNAPYYHFAFNIPSFQIAEALRWLEERLEPLSDEGQQIIDFSSWNAKAVYFKDPAGNIVEFIARKDLMLHSEGPFSIVDIEGVSEIGLPVEEVRSAYEQLHQKTGIEKYSGDYERFCATGDEQGLFIIVDQHNKTWYPTDKPAVPSPFELDFSQQGSKYHLSYDGKKIDLRKG